MASEATYMLSKMLVLLVFIFVFSPAAANDYGGEKQWIFRDTCPTKIHAVIPNRSPFGGHGVVHESMKTCRNITELDLYATFGSCTESPDRWSMPFALDGSDRYLSSPRVLSLETYEFDYSEWADIVPPRPHWSNEDGTSRWYKWSNLLVEQRLKDNMELWLEAMDFSKVHTLSLSDKTFKPMGKGLRLLPEALKNLRSLRVTGRWVNWKTELEIWEAELGPLPKNKLKSPRPPRARDFIMALPSSSLTNLTWMENWTCDPDVFDMVLRHHGASLRHLEWTNPEIVFDPRPTLSIDQLRELGKWAPELTNLTIDLNRKIKTGLGKSLKLWLRTCPS